MPISDSSKSNKKLASARRALAALGLAGIVSVALAQDTANRYAQLLKEAEIATRYNAHIEQLLQSQESEISSLEAQLATMDETVLEVPNLLQRMFDDLEQFVSSDLPFLRQERTERIARLRELMDQVDAMPSEKYRRLMEAYQIEMEYGRTMDFYRDTLADGREAEFVKLGRVSLMYQTLDGTETGYWDRQQGTWVVDDRYAEAVETAIRMANNEGARELLTIPVPAAQEGRS
jgi:chromosome segregation ATPase